MPYYDYKTPINAEQTVITTTVRLVTQLTATYLTATLLDHIRQICTYITTT